MSENTTIIESLTEISTEIIDDQIGVNEELKFIIVPLAVIATVMLLSAMVFLMARKRRMSILRHRLMPLYNFDKNEYESNWETDLLNCIDNPNYSGYCTTKFIED